ncbi:twitching motility protein PilT [bacterium C-53]|nr:twitching motility protein PilT [Lachnospiraceae bacterium]NBI01901.1 twitching motility protein PilT [Lachnospiraceae bacterium]RKJ12304.1 twitching motility protein PilT [bacterium C-53]
MVQLIVGEKGKGKTKVLLDKVNEASKSANGNIVFLDKDSQHMYELKNAIRLVNTKDYFISNPEEFVGFVSGIIASDHDLEQIYIDRFFKVSFADDSQVAEVLRRLDKISEKFDVVVTVSISITSAEVADDLKSKIIAEL